MQIPLLLAEAVLHIQLCCDEVHEILQLEQML
jgi:hypothetical protein